MKSICILLFTVISFASFAQEKNIVLNTDTRLDQLSEAIHAKSSETTTKKSNKAKGFRVQIYNGNDRQKASNLKMQFMKEYPGVRSYMVFTSPQYRLKVGDFKTRAEADAFSSKIKSLCSPCMIVTETINVKSSK